MAKRGYYPAPVYVGTFEDGSIGRVSFWSQAGKPIDFERGKRLLAWAYSRPEIVWQFPDSRRHDEARASFYRDYEPRQIIAGYVEFQGKRLVENQVVNLRSARYTRQGLVLALEAALAELRKLGADQTTAAMQVRDALQRESLAA